MIFNLNLYYKIKNYGIRENRKASKIINRMTIKWKSTYLKNINFNWNEIENWHMQLIFLYTPKYSFFLSHLDIFNNKKSSNDNMKSNQISNYRRFPKFKKVDDKQRFSIGRNWYCLLLTRHTNLYRFILTDYA